MKRQTWYPGGEIIEDTVLMAQERDIFLSLSRWILDAFGSQNSAFTGFAATPGTGLALALAEGALYQYGTMDPTTWSDMPSSSTQTLLQGFSDGTTLAATNFPAPTTSGQSIKYLIEAQLVVADATAVDIPFSNGATPPSLVTQNLSPSRSNVITFQVKAGTAATTGDETAPATDSGWVPLYVVTVAYGTTQLESGDIALASGAPEFYGFVQINPSGNTPVYLSPESQQTGYINISGYANVGSIVAGYGLIGPSAALVTNYASAWLGGFCGDSLNLTAIGWTGSSQTTDSLNIAGSIGYTGTHAGTDADPYPLSQLNVAMLGDKVASDYALASDNYIIVYSGTPTLASGNAGVTGYFESSIATGTAPFIIASTTMVANLNVEYLGGCGAGNSSGDIPIANGALCENLNAALLAGQPGSYYQPAGDYAEMDATNTGTFSATGTVSTTGGTGSAQTTLGYLATNTWGANSGGPVSYLSGTDVLVLNAPSVQTTGPLAVGSSASPQNLTAQDLIPSGLLRAGQCIYTVTYGNSSNSYPYPGNGTAYGTYASATGQIAFPADTVSSGKFYLGFRCVVTVASARTVSFQGLGYTAATVYVDGTSIGTVGFFTSAASTTLSIGTHTIDVVYASKTMGNPYYLGSEGLDDPQGGSFMLFGWVPLTDGQIDSSITALVPG